MCPASEMKVTCLSDLTLDTEVLCHGSHLQNKESIEQHAWVKICGFSPEAGDVCICKILEWERNIKKSYNHKFTSQLKI